MKRYGILRFVVNVHKVVLVVCSNMFSLLGKFILFL